MKKISTLFTRVYKNHKIIDILPEITPGCEEAFLHGTATVKIDGEPVCKIKRTDFALEWPVKNG